MICPNCGQDNVQGADLCTNCGSDLAGLDLPEAEGGFRGRLFTDRIGDLPLNPSLSVTPETTVAQAVEQMRQERHGCVLVQEAEKLVGIFTERDVLSRVARPGRDPERTTMTDVMTPKPFTLLPTDPPIFAIHSMVVRGLRHLPVLDGSKLLGFISVRTILLYIRELTPLPPGRQSGV